MATDQHFTLFLSLFGCVLAFLALGLVLGLEVRLVVPAVALPMTGLAADQAWRRRNIVLGFAIVFSFGFAFAARLAFMEGVELLSTIRRQIHRVWRRAGKSLRTSHTVDLGLQCFPRGQPSTVEDKVLFQRSIRQHALSNAGADVVWEVLAGGFLVAVGLCQRSATSPSKLKFKSSCNRPCPPERQHSPLVSDQSLCTSM